VQLLLKDVLDAWSDDTIVDVPGGKHCVYIRLNRMVLYRHDCVPRIIMSLIVETTDNVLQVYRYTDTLEDSTWSLDCAFDPHENERPLFKVMQSLFGSTVLVKGVRDILDFYMDEGTILCQRAEYWERCVVPVVVTRGSNLSTILSQIPWVDHVHTTTNNVLEIYNELGIDAAENAISYELESAMSIGTCRGYIRLISSIMCQTGTLRALTFNGMTRSTASKSQASSIRAVHELFMYM